MNRFNDKDFYQKFVKYFWSNFWLELDLCLEKQGLKDTDYDSFVIFDIIVSEEERRAK